MFWTGSSGSTPRSLAVSGINCMMPRAPLGLLAAGSSPDSCWATARASAGDTPSFLARPVMISSKVAGRSGISIDLDAVDEQMAVPHDRAGGARRRGRFRRIGRPPLARVWRDRLGRGLHQGVEQPQRLLDARFRALLCIAREDAALKIHDGLVRPLRVLLGLGAARFRDGPGEHVDEGVDPRLELRDALAIGGLHLPKPIRGTRSEALQPLF